MIAPDAVPSADALDANGCRRLLAKIILLAVQDLRGGRRCTAKNCDGYYGHRCVADALAFVKDDYFIHLLDLLDIADPFAVRSRLLADLPKADPPWPQMPLPGLEP